MLSFVSLEKIPNKMSILYRYKLEEVIEVGVQFQKKARELQNCQDDSNQADGGINMEHSPPLLTRFTEEEEDHSSTDIAMKNNSLLSSIESTSSSCSSSSSFETLHQHFLNFQE